jgi:hypothetical protein
MKTILAGVLVTLFCSALVFANTKPTPKYTIGQVFKEAVTQDTVTIFFSEGDLTKIKDQLNDPAEWLIVLYEKPSGRPRRVVGSRGSQDLVPDTSSNLSDGIVRIHLQPALALTDKDCIVVLFLGANVPEKNSCEYTVPLSSGFLVSASDKKVADLYINGSYSPALNGPAQYSIDSFVTLAWDLPGEKKSVGPSVPDVFQ